MSPANESPVRVACVGASITFGLGLKDRREECYPAVLQRLLESSSPGGFLVRNFGYSGATAGRTTREPFCEPYWETPSFTAAERFEPHLVLLALGTNDAQTVNLANGPDFAKDFRALADHFLGLPSVRAMAAASPPPVFPPLPAIDIRFLDETIRPEIKRVAEEKRLKLVDAYSPFLDRPELFPDNLHPNAEGARLLAGLAHQAMEESGWVG